MPRDPTFGILDSERAKLGIDEIDEFLSVFESLISAKDEDVCLFYRRRSRKTLLESIDGETFDGCNVVSQLELLADCLVREI